MTTLVKVINPFLRFICALSRLIFSVFRHREDTDVCVLFIWGICKCYMKVKNLNCFGCGQVSLQFMASAVNYFGLTDVAVHQNDQMMLDFS